MYQDSTGQSIQVGDRVEFRGQIYTIRKFLPGKGRCGTAEILFLEGSDQEEIADEISVDLVYG